MTFGILPVATILIHQIFAPGNHAYISSYFHRPEFADRYSGTLKLVMHVVSIVVHQYFFILVLVGNAMAEMFPITYCVGYFHGYKAVNEGIVRLRRERRMKLNPKLNASILAVISSPTKDALKEDKHE